MKCTYNEMNTVCKMLFTSVCRDSEEKLPAFNENVIYTIEYMLEHIINDTSYLNSLTKHDNTPFTDNEIDYIVAMAYDRLEAVNQAEVNNIICNVLEVIYGIDFVFGNIDDSFGGYTYFCPKTLEHFITNMLECEYDENCT